MSGLGPSSRRIGGATRLVGLIGWPVAGSLSPAIHAAAFAAHDLDWAYLPLPVRPDDLPAAMAGLPALGFAGANVTMPHKEGAARLADARTPEVDRIRAANTLVVGPDGVVAHNTDAPGFALFLSDDAGFDPAGRTALVFGAGGAARACAWALASGGLADLAVAVREPGRAGALVEALEGTGTEVRVLSLDRAPDLEADLVVNATPLGALGEVPPHPPFRPGMLVVDLLYSPAVTPLVARARAGGAAAFGGLGLLVHQAALSYTLWTGQRAPIEAMSAAAAAALPAPPGLAGA